MYRIRQSKSYRESARAETSWGNVKVYEIRYTIILCWRRDVLNRYSSSSGTIASKDGEVFSYLSRRRLQWLNISWRGKANILRGLVHHSLAHSLALSPSPATGGSERSLMFTVLREALGTQDVTVDWWVNLCCWHLHLPMHFPALHPAISDNGLFMKVTPRKCLLVTATESLGTSTWQPFQILKSSQCLSFYHCTLVKVVECK